MIRKLLLSVVMVVCAASAVSAGDGGTDSPFSLGAGARELAMGGAAAASAHPSVAPFWNPSRLIRSERMYVSGFHSNLYESDVAYQYFSLVYPTLDYGSFGFGVFRLGVDDIEERDASNVMLGTFDESRLGFFLAYALNVSGYDIGLAATMEHHSLGDYSATSSPGLNMSIARQFTLTTPILETFRVALTGRNVVQPGTKLDAETVKEPLVIGVAGELALQISQSGNQNLSLSAALSKTESLDARLAAGVEYSFDDMLAVRGGSNDGKLSFGAGLSYGGFTFDYALVDRDMGSLHMFTLTTAFGTPMSVKRENRRNRQESEFNSLMQDRLTATNKKTVEQLVKRGKKLLDEEDYLEAYQQFDRALLLARGAGLDTTDIAVLSANVKKQLEEKERLTRYEANLKAAQTRLINGDYLAARHFAEMALIDSTQSGEAQDVVKRCDAAVAESSARDKLITERLLEVDSLLSYGFIDKALASARTLDRFADQNANVRLAIKRVEFEYWREKAVGAFARGNITGAQASLDSAQLRFPKHQWCADFRVELEASKLQAKNQSSAVSKPVVQHLSEELQKEIETATRAGQKAFEHGDLDDAIQQWEKVERIAPNYGSVREYLLHAYKFVGVELYGQNKLEDAVEVWKKAAALDPNNEEIAEYIRRTENEIRKIRELSYDEH